MKNIILNMGILVFILFVTFSHSSGFDYPNPVTVEELLINPNIYDGEKISIEFIFSTLEEFKGRSNSLNLKGSINTPDGMLNLLTHLPLDGSKFPMQTIKEDEHMIAHGIFKNSGMFAGRFHENFIILDHMESLDRPVTTFKKKKGA